MNPVEIKNLYFKYEDGENNILNGVNLNLGRSEIISVTGLSGCGKTTLCYCICGIIPHIYRGLIKGTVNIFGKPVKEMSFGLVSTRVGVVFQDYDMQLFSPTVEDEIAFGPENLCLGHDEIKRRVDTSLGLVNMEKYRFEHPENLSGGEKQLVAIASILSMEPDVLIFDESLSRLDEESRDRIKKTILLLKKSGKSIMLVDHGVENFGISDRIFFLEKGKLTEIDKQEKLEGLIELYKI